MLRDMLIEYGVPIAGTLAVAVGGMAINNQQSIAVIESENKTMLELQHEMHRDIKDMSRIVYRLEAKVEVQDEQR